MAERFDGLEAHLPLVARALPFIGHYQTRARGTVCGSIAHADPSSELPLCLATLGGEVVLRSSRGTRTMAASDFQQDVLTTACEPDEMIVAVRFPLHAPGEGCAFAEFGIRHGDFCDRGGRGAGERGSAAGSDWRLVPIDRTPRNFRHSPAKRSRRD